MTSDWAAPRFGHVSTASIQQQGPVTASQPIRVPRSNPWQRVLGLIALIPAMIGAAFCLAAFLTHNQGIAQGLELTTGLSAFGVAFSLALIWLLAGAINWQIKEAVRARR